MGDENKSSIIEWHKTTEDLPKKDFNRYFLVAFKTLNGSLITRTEKYLTICRNPESFIYWAYMPQPPNVEESEYRLDSRAGIRNGEK